MSPYGEGLTCGNPPTCGFSDNRQARGHGFDSRQLHRKSRWATTSGSGNLLGLASPLYRTFSDWIVAVWSTGLPEDPRSVGGVDHPLGLR